MAVFVDKAHVEQTPGGMFATAGFGLFFSWLLGAGLGAFGASIPDAIESSKRRGPNHRGVFHSKVVLIGICGLFYAVFGNYLVIEDGMGRLLILAFLAGYASHLLTDALFTKTRLPLLF